MSVSERGIIRSEERERTRDTHVMKFGGTSVGGAEAIERVAQIVYEHRKMGNLIVIVSAMQGVTDSLLLFCSNLEAGNYKGAEDAIGKLKQRHIAVCDGLEMPSLCRFDIEDEIACLFDELLEEIKEGGSLTHEKRDRVLSYGERASTRMVGARLRMLMPVSIIDSSELIRTDDTFSSAVPDFEQTRVRVRSALPPLLQRGITPVITGFIGATSDGRVTTLGRNSSDYVAALIGAGVGAKEVWFWKTVDGVFTVDPNKNVDAQLVPHMTNEAYKIKYKSQVLDERAALVLWENRIPSRVKNTNNPHGEGTRIIP